MELTTPDTYIVQFFGIGCDPKPGFDFSVLDNFDPRPIVERADYSYVPTELEDTVFRYSFILDTLHRYFRTCPVSFTASIEAADLDLYKSLADRSDENEKKLSELLYDTALVVLGDKMAYNRMRCIYTVYINSALIAGGKVNRYTNMNTDTYNIHFSVLALRKEVTDTDRKLVQTILKKRTMLSEYYEKFYVCMSVEQSAVLDFVNTFDREADNALTNIDPSRAGPYIDALKKEVGTLNGVVDQIDGILNVRADTHFLIFGSSGSEHLAECCAVLADSMSRMGYT